MGFGNIFWGFLFLFDIRIGGVDLLPDIIGYLFIFYGLSDLFTDNDRFGTARRDTFPLIVLSLLDVYQFPQTSGTVSSSVLFITLAQIIALIINLHMVYNICLGIADRAHKKNNTALEVSSVLRWKLYLVLQLIPAAAIVIGLFVPPYIAVPLRLTTIFQIISVAFMMVLAKQAGQALK